MQNHTSALSRWRLWTPLIGPCELLYLRRRKPGNDLANRRFENLITSRANTVNTWMRFDVHMNAYPLRGCAVRIVDAKSTDAGADPARQRDSGDIAISSCRSAAKNESVR